MNSFLPLYARVRETLIERLDRGDWRPGGALPSEIALARELGVSQGTVRKAIDSLCGDGVITRVQGRGTFVAEHTVEWANFRFFRLVDSTGQRVVPELRRQIAGVEDATPEMAAALNVAAGDTVHVIDRLRSIAGQRAILERVVVSEAVMPGLSAHPDLPNALYPFYQERFGISVLRTDERLSAILATARQARALRVPAGTALLQAERRAYDLASRIIEYRLSHFLTQGHAYSIELRAGSV